MEQETFEVGKICRTCLRFDTDLKSLFNEKDNDGIPIAKMIAACIKYPVNEDDEFPNQICPQCVADTKVAFEFKRTCEKSYETLKSLVSTRDSIPGEILKLVDNQTSIIYFKESDVSCDERYTEKFTQTEDSECAQLTQSEEVESISTQQVHECSICQKKYLREVHLKKHFLVAHPEASPNLKTSCNACETDFSSSEELQVHVLTCPSKSSENPPEDQIQNVNNNETPVYFDEQSETHQSDTSINVDSTINVALTSLATNLPDGVKVEIKYETDEAGMKNIEVEPFDEEFGFSNLEEGHCSDVNDTESGEDEKTNSFQQNGSDVKDKDKEDKSDEPNKSDSPAKRRKRTKKKQKDDKTHQCEVCDKVFSRATHLKRHSLTHCDKKPYSCTVCKKAFTRNDHLNLHMHHHAEVKPFICDICNRGFVRSEHLRKHKESRHGHKTATPKSEFCEICKKGFTTPKYLQIHMRTHTDRTWNCKFCSEKFKSKPELQEHLKTHANEKPFLCSECGLRFVRNDYLVIHMRRHKGEKPYKCKFCGKGFPRATDLTVHERYHTGEKTHLCTICGKGFQRAYNLLVHTRVHTGERPYQCPHCSKSFAQGNDLKAHVRRHTGERFKCEICGDGFIQGYHLTQHKRTVHGIDMKSHIRRVAKFTTPIEQQQQMMAIKEAASQGNDDKVLVVQTIPEQTPLIVSDINMIKIEQKPVPTEHSITFSSEQPTVLVQQKGNVDMNNGNFNACEPVFYAEVDPKLKVEPGYE